MPSVLLSSNGASLQIALMKLLAKRKVTFLKSHLTDTYSLKQTCGMSFSEHRMDRIQKQMTEHTAMENT